MAAQKKYPDELRERAVKMLFEVREREGKGRGELARVARQLQGDSKIADGNRLITTSNRGPGGPMYGGNRHCPLN